MPKCGRYRPDSQVVAGLRYEKSPDLCGPGSFRRRLPKQPAPKHSSDYCKTSRVTVVVWVTPAPLAVIVMVWVPVLEFLPTLTVMVEVPDPGAAMELGLKVTVWALPCPEAVKAIAESKPPEMVVVMVDVPELPLATLIDVGDALMVKLALVPVTVRETVVVSVVLPEVPVTVML